MSAHFKLTTAYKKMKIFLKLLLISIIVSGCTSNKKQQAALQNKHAIPIKEHSVLAVLWQQNAAEYRALCHQAFNIARLRLDELVLNNKSIKPLAIITDVDETILDNSPYSAQLIRDDKDYNKESWFEWGRKESAELIPGAHEFIKHAESLGVEIFYVSNRYEAQLEETIANLKKHGLANADKSHIFLKTTTSGKQTRRNRISNTHEVLLLLGDNLSDFEAIYDKQSSLKRHKYVENNKNSFGNKFIVFPNPLYGDWEFNGLYESNQLTEDEKQNIRIIKLKYD